MPNPVWSLGLRRTVHATDPGPRVPLTVMNSRNLKIDNLKGLMIACVVLGHAIDIIPESSGWRDGGGWSALYSAIYLFH